MNDNLNANPNASVFERVHVIYRTLERLHYDLGNLQEAAPVERAHHTNYVFPANPNEKMFRRVRLFSLTHV